MNIKIMNCFKRLAPAFVIISLLLITGCIKDQLGSNDPAVNDTTGVDCKPSIKHGHHPRGDSSVFVVDQSNTTIHTWFGYNSLFFTPFGQEFVPGLNALDVVELTLDDASCGMIGGPGGEVKVQIRRSTIDGQIIGISDTVQFSNCFYGVKRFNFPTYVPVTPGQKYVIEVIYVDGNTCSIYLDDGPSPLYLKGSTIFEGVVDPNRDLWFREGLDQSIARTKDQVYKKGWHQLVRRDGTGFNNQDDCLQYVNNSHGPQ
jgi:hypothetical protein